MLHGFVSLWPTATVNRVGCPAPLVNSSLNKEICGTADGRVSRRIVQAASGNGCRWRLAGYYVGREFRFTGLRAVWMATQGQIRFYGDDGAVLRVVEVGEPRKEAA